MSNQNSVVQPSHSRSEPAMVVRAPAVVAGNDFKPLLRVLPFWLISLVIHISLFALCLWVGSLGATATIPTVEVAIPETTIDDIPKEPEDLSIDEIGNDPEVPTNYNVDRIADVSVPGVVVANETIGMPGAPEGPMQTVPPPPGLGNTGTGMAPLSNEFSGLGTEFGLPGGYRGLTQPGGFGGRSAATREKMLREGGGTSQSEAAVGAGLMWLALHQSTDGRWVLDQFHRHAHDHVGDGARMLGNCNCTGPGRMNDTAATAFGLLPFLGAGQTHKPSNSKTRHDYSKNVASAVRWLMGHQTREGDFGGGMYAHGLATIAMCEAYGLTADPTLKAAAQKAINYIVKAQDPTSGGWRYRPRKGGDTSVVGWQVMALKSGQMAGLMVPTPTLQGAKRWLDSCQTSDGGGYGYTDREPTPTMTAVGLLCRQYLGWSPRNPGLLHGVARLKKWPPSSSLKNMYYYYYATQVMHHMGGECWQSWNPKMRDLLVNNQDQGRDPKHSHQKGSWSPGKDMHGGVGGRLMITSLSLLCLEVYYRHLPLYRRDFNMGKEVFK